MNYQTWYFQVHLLRHNSPRRGSIPGPLCLFESIRVYPSLSESIQVYPSLSESIRVYNIKVSKNQAKKICQKISRKKIKSDKKFVKKIKKCKKLQNLPGLPGNGKSVPYRKDLSQANQHQISTQANMHQASQGRNPNFSRRARRTSCKKNKIISFRSRVQF